MDIIKKPVPKSSAKDVVRAFRRHYRAKMLGIGALAAGAVGVPFLMACSCPSWTAHYVHPLSAEAITQTAGMDNDERCDTLCNAHVESCTFAHMASTEPLPDGEVQSLVQGRSGPPENNVVMCEVEERMMCGMGRPPEGLLRAKAAAERQGVLRRPATDSRPALASLGAYFAEAARYEAAAVLSFVQFATELEALGAPPELVRAAEDAAVDEVHHARGAHQLACQLGARPVAPAVQVPTPRSLVVVLKENATMGGVIERFGAWMLGEQARTATDPRAQAWAASLVDDEVRHADLSDDVTGWGRSRLTVDEQKEVDDAVVAIREALAADYEHDDAAPHADLAGLPTAARVREFMTGWT